MIFKNRKQAGQKLAGILEGYEQDKTAIVLGLARGGVVTAEVVAKRLGLALDLLVVKKIGAPGNEEFALGAVTQTGTGFFDDRIIDYYGIDKEYIEQEQAKAIALAQEKNSLYRGDRSELDLTGKKTILVDDGLATGASMIAAAKCVKELGAQKIIIATPVAAPDSLEKIRQYIDEIKVLESTNLFLSVGQFYRKFDQVTDKQVQEIMKTN
ncbi:MAG: phosphoribosyltransferase [Candidatus Moranbacteria bacterium]|nr:phosphoribosyltransferase [Candidatus Moranbacteria bacterium]